MSGVIRRESSRESRRETDGARAALASEEAGNGSKRTPLACRVFSHRYRFDVEGSTVVWRCRRCSHVGGERAYEDEREARRYAARLNRGSPGPPVGLLTATAGTVLDPRRRRRGDTSGRV